MTTVNEERGHEFEKEQGHIVWIVWQKEKEGRNNVIIL